jgi:DNA polymerase III gamma/tau subunit
MPAADILGHRAQLACLEADLEQGNVAHAYLFCGARHLGKSAVAKWFAQQLLTQGIQGEERAAAVEQIERLLHPDLLVIDQLWIEDACEDFAVIARSSNVAQQHRAKAKAKTDTISIDDIRSLQERLHEVGTGIYRCCIIRSVERMQAEAVNALLKILEEPPEGVVFLLTTQSLSSLLPTLISRTRTLHFARLTEAELAPLLQNLGEDERQFLLRIAQGAPGIVKNLRENPDLLRREKQAYSSALAFWHSRSAVERLQLLTPLHERSEEADAFLLHLFLALREEYDQVPPHLLRHLLDLCRDRETNVNRQLLAQRFVVGLAA